MAEHSPVEIVRHASTLSILWGVLLIVFGILAVGSPFLAAVAVNVVIAWLIILAGVVHVILAFHAHRAGRLIWKLLVGLAYLFFGAYLIMHPVLGVATLTLVLASLFLKASWTSFCFSRCAHCGDRAGCWLRGSSPSC